MVFVRTLRERESVCVCVCLECKNYRLRTLVEVRTEMAAWSRVVPRRRTSDMTGGGLLVTAVGVQRIAAAPAGVSSCYILLTRGERRQRGSGG
jgi:hypothetical protein